MPFNSHYRKRSNFRRRRRPRRRNRRRSKQPGRLGTVRIPSAMQFALPAKLQTTMNFTKLLNYTAATAFKNIQTIAINNMFDSFGTLGANDQPMLYDELSAIYGRWYVSAVELTVGLINNDPNAGVSLMGFVNTDNTATLNYSQTRSQPQCWEVHLGPSTGGHNTQTKSAYYYIKKFSTAQDMDDLSGVVAAGPADLVYFNLYSQNLSTTAFHDVSVTWKINFYVQWYSMVVLSDS